MDRRKQGGCVCVVGSSLDPNRALGDGGEHIFRRHRAFWHFAQRQAVQSGHSQKSAHSNPVLKLLEARLNVAAEFHDLEVRAIVQKLCPTPERGRPYLSALWQRAQLKITQ